MNNNTSEKKYAEKEYSRIKILDFNNTDIQRILNPFTTSLETRRQASSDKLSWNITMGKQRFL
jgi:hypothetical protein